MRIRKTILVSDGSRISQRKERQLQRWERQPITVVNCLQKQQENEKILTGGGGVPGAPTLFGSANVSCSASPNQINFDKTISFYCVLDNVISTSVCRIILEFYKEIDLELWCQDSRRYIIVCGNTKHQILGRRYKKSKTGVPVAPQRGLISSKISFWRNTPNNIF